MQCNAMPQRPRGVAVGNRCRYCRHRIAMSVPWALGAKRGAGSRCSGCSGCWVWRGRCGGVRKHAAWLVRRGRLIAPVCGRGRLVGSKYTSGLT
jgi:hypothetical protein